MFWKIWGVVSWEHGKEKELEGSLMKCSRQTDAYCTLSPHIPTAVMVAPVLRAGWGSLAWASYLLLCQQPVRSLWPGWCR